MQKLFAFLLIFPVYVLAQKLPSIEEKTKDLKKYEGFMNFYWDENSGKIWLEIDRLDTEILYVSSLPAGLGSNDIGLDRGLLGGERIVRFSKTGRKIFLIQPNYNYRAITDDVAEKELSNNLLLSQHCGALQQKQKQETTISSMLLIF